MTFACPTCQRRFRNCKGFGVHLRFCGMPDAKTLFWLKVAKGDGCWLWKGRADKSGYGRNDRKGPYVYAHRTAWLYTFGEIPAGMDVCHTCDVRNCCNPDHLWLGTAAENMEDARKKDRHAWGERSRRNKLTAAQVLEIRRDFRKSGKGRRCRSNASELARKYGVREHAIQGVIYGRTWRNLK